MGGGLSRNLLRHAAQRSGQDMGEGERNRFRRGRQRSVNLKKTFGASACPSSSCRLRSRSCGAGLVGRGTDSAETIEKRVAKAEQEIAHAPQFDRVIVNDSLEEAVAEAEKTVAEFIG